MDLHRRTHRWIVLLTALVALTTAGAGQALPPTAPQPDVIELAQQTEPPPRELEPRYQPVPPQPKSWYNNSYIFALTRGVSNSTMAPAAQAPLFLLTVPLDLVLLPFAAIGGLFG
jgi:hypothetical protein